MRCKVEVVGKDSYFDGNGRLQERETGRYSNEYDLETAQFANIVLCNVFSTASTVKDTTGTNRSIPATSATSNFLIVAGTSSTAATVTDYALNAIATGGSYSSSGTSGSQTATIGSYSGSGTSGNFTATATITNSSASSITYAEVGIACTCATYTFLLTHDVLSPTIPVSGSSAGTLTVTYTLTFQ